MSTTRRFAASVAVVALALAALTGCIGAGPVGTKTDAIRQQLVTLPGVLDSSTTLNEHTILSFPHSLIELTVDPKLTAAQAERIVTTFAHANVESGLDVVSSELHLVAGVDRLELLNSAVTDAQATTLADQWISLRSRYTSTVLAMVPASGRAFEVNLSVGLKTTGTEDALIDMHDVAPALAAIGGDVGHYDQVDGHFRTDFGLPDDEVLSLVDGINSVLAADGTDPGLVGVYSGLAGSFELVATVAESTDAATGLNAAAVRLLDALGAAARGVQVEFVSAADKHVIATFDSRDCSIYVDLPADDPSRELLAYWTRDGRTLLDGSTAESCVR